MRAAAAAGVDLEVIRDIDAARVHWAQLAERGTNVFGTWEWADSWYRHLHPDAELALGLVRCGGTDPVAILPVCIARRRPLRLLRLMGAGPSDQLGPICAPEDRVTAAAAMRAHIDRILAGSGIFLGERLLSEDGLAPIVGDVVVRRTPSPILSIGDRTFEDFLASRSHNFRGQVRRRLRRLARLGAQYRLTRDPGTLEADMRTLIRLHRARWSRGESTVFTAPGDAFQLDFARRALDRGWLRLWTMTIDGVAVAAWYGLRYAGIDSYYQAGRDPAYEHLSVGFALLCHSVMSAFADGMHEYRFGSGGEAYKYRFADRDPGLETVAIAAGVRGRLALRALQTALRTPKRLQRPMRRIAKLR